MPFVLSFMQPRAGFVDPDMVVQELKQHSCDHPSEVWDFLSKGSVMVQGVRHPRKQVTLQKRKPMESALAPRQEFLPCDEYPHPMASH